MRHKHLHTGISHYTIKYLQAMTIPIALRPGLVKCDQIYIRASKFSDKNTICINKRARHFRYLIWASALQNYLSSAADMHAHTHTNTNTHTHTCTHAHTYIHERTHKNKHIYTYVILTISFICKIHTKR
jgi:hypothetical protein